MSIQFQSLWFENLMSYGAKRTIIDFDSGFNLVCGKNGQGKSVIPDALSYCLYGVPYRNIKIEELVNRTNKRNMKVGCKFTVSGEEYEIIRGKKPDSLIVTKNGLELESLSSKKLVQEEIDKILGLNFKLFKNIISLGVCNTKPFLTLSLDEKRQIIESIFNVNIFGEMLKNLKKIIANMKIDLEMEQRTIAMMKERIVEDRKRLLDFQQAKVDFEAGKIKDIENIKSEIQKLIEKIGFEEQILLQIQNPTEDTDNQLKAEIESLDTEISKKKIEVNEKINGVKEKIAEKNVKDKEKETLLLQRLSTKQSEFDLTKSIIDQDHQQKSKTFDADIESIGKQITSIDEQIQPKKSIQAKVTELETSKATHLYSIKQAEEEISFYKNNDVCFKCRQKIENKVEVIAEQEAKILSSKDEIAKIDNMIQVVLDKIKQLEEIEKGKEELVKKKNEVLMKKSSEDKDFVHKLSDAKAFVANEVSKINRDIEAINNSVEKIQLANELKQLTSSSIVSDLENKKALLVSRINNHQSEIQQQITSKKQLIELLKSNKKQTEIRLTETEQKQFQIDIITFQTQFDQKCEEYKKLNQTIKEKQESLDCHNTSAELLSDKGVKSYFFRKLIPIFNQKVNDYLLTFNLPIKIEFDEFINETISDLSGNHDVSYYSFSGGERTKIDISILFGFIDVNKMLNNFDCNLLFIDEILDNQIDNEGIVKFFEYLKVIIKNNSKLCCYVVSHRAQEFDGFDAVFEIKKKSGFSQIEKRNS